MQNLKYLSFVGSRWPFVYVATPKVACSTLKSVLYHLEGKTPYEPVPGMPDVHHRFANGIGWLEDMAALQQMQQDPARCFFAVVRNPYSRLVSAWDNKIWQQSPKYREIQRKISTYLGLSPDTPPDFAGFVEWLHHTQDPARCDLHWRAQTQVLRPDLVNYRHLLRTENLATGLSVVLSDLGCTESATELLQRCTTNTSLPRDWRFFYDSHTAERVHGFYRQDFEQYGYDPHGWQIPEGTETASDTVALQRQLAHMHETAIRMIRKKNHQIYLLQQQLRQA